MKFKLEIDCGNAAFMHPDDGGESDAYREGEVARILRAVAERVEMAGLTEGACYDINGNRVGDFRLTR
jgi:hypothetical protein